MLIALIGAVWFSGCDPGSLPKVRSAAERADYRRDWYPTASEEPLPLDRAIHAGDLAEVNRLLQSGANPNARWGQSGDRFPLQEVFERGSYGYRIGDPVTLVRLLLRHGADPNMKWCPFESRATSFESGCTQERAMTPLIFASFTNSRDLVEMLLAAGADATHRDWGGASALDYAYDEVIFEMISRTLFPDVSTRNQLALAWISRSEGSPYDNSLWRQLPITRALRQHEGVGFPGPPPVAPEAKVIFQVDHEARTLGRLRTLLRIGADPNQRLTQSGVDSTPLSLALRAKQLRSARLLLTNGADVNLRWCTQYEVKDYKVIPSSPPGCSLENGMTPLMWAASTDDREAARLLLEYRADRSLRDWAGRAALDHATAPEMRELLTATPPPSH